MNKPNLFIVGAAKSGTTTLYSYLEKHSKIFMPSDMLYKEPCYFSEYGEKMGYDRYLNIFQNASSKVHYIGEASTAYLTDSQSAQKIYEYNPNAKIIIILRNPADRAYSLYNWTVQEGYEYAISFKHGLNLEQKRKKRLPNFWEPIYKEDYMYFSSGLYYEQVKNYYEIFPNSNIKVILFEEMIKNVNATYQSVCDFLDIPYESIFVEHENISLDIYHPILSYLARKLNYLNLFINKFTNHIQSIEDRDFIVYALQKKQKVKKMNPDIRKQLLNQYESDIKSLESLLNINLDLWRTQR